MEELMALNYRDYGLYCAVLVVSRSMDFLSTWIATPNLLLEANPIAKKLGWKWGILINLVLCFGFAVWPLPAIVIATTSALVAARNFQSAWVMHTLGEHGYREWVIERLDHTPPGLYVFCLLAQGVLIGGVGGILMACSKWQLAPFAIGLGILTYALAVVVYSLLGWWRARRQLRTNF